MKEARLVVDAHKMGDGPYTSAQMDEIVETVNAARTADVPLSDYLNPQTQGNGHPADGPTVTADAASVYEVPESAHAQGEVNAAAGGLLSLVTQDLAQTQAQAIQVATQVAERKAAIISSIPALSNQIAAQMLMDQQFVPQGMAGVLANFRLPEVRIGLGSSNQPRAISAAQN
jgi:uncharacterized protein YdbL (DUF1318 family)